MAAVFGGQSSRASTPTVPVPAAALSIQTSVQGKPRPIGWGTGMLAGNLIYLNDFTPVLIANYSTPAQQSAGKGGRAGTQAAQPTYAWVYYVNVNISLGEGVVADFLSFTGDGMVQSHYADNTGGGNRFYGTQDQLPFGGTASMHPDKALAYRGEAYLAYSPMYLGEKTSVPNFTFEVRWSISGFSSTFPLDANARDIVRDFLTNEHYGVPGFTTDMLGDDSSYWAFCQTYGLAMSPILTDQTEASQFLQTIMQATYSELVWSGGKLRPIPYGEFYANGNGAEFFPNNTPDYDLSVDDFLPLQGGTTSGSGSVPVGISRKPAQDRINRVRIEFLDRSNIYTPAEIDHKDEADIVMTRERPSDVRTMHFFKNAFSASQSVSLQLQREQVVCTYSFTLPKKFIRIEIMDLIRLPLDEFDLADEPVVVRIKEIEENDDYSLTFTAEDYFGASGAATIPRQTASLSIPDFNADPGPLNTPAIFEPPDELGGGLFVFAAVSGQSTNWGGADVYVSTDDVNYTKAGRVLGPSRMGVTTNDLPTGFPSLTGTTVDTTNVLGVDLSSSKGELAPGTQADMLAGNTASYISGADGAGEIIAYQDVTLTAANQYNLSTLHRGAYGSAIIDHPAGSQFVRVDGRVVRIPFDQTRIGQNVYIKFVSFNVWGGGAQTIDAVGAYPYKITGSALTSALPSIASTWAVFKASFDEIWWEEISDFRSGIRYIIKKGESFAAALQVGDVAHPPFTAFGEGTYWIIAYYISPVGTIAYSETPASLSLVGNMLVDNVILTSDQQAEGWTGTRTNLDIAGTFPAQTLVLSLPDVFALTDAFAPADIFTLPQDALSGVYEIPSSDVVDVGYLGRCNINVTWNAAGVPIGSDILTVEDFLAAPDILSASYSANVTSFVEICVSADGSTFSSWQRFVPGMYVGRKFKLRVTLATNDPRITAVLLAFKVQISVEPRTDHYRVNATAGTNTITFRPEGAASDAGFNGGPNGQTVPYWTASWSQSAGDIFVVTALSLTSISFQILNGGTPVARSGVNVDVQGY